MFRFRVLVLCLGGILLAGCAVITIEGSGEVLTQEEGISGFDKVNVSHGFDVEIRQAESYGVTIRVDENIVEYLQVTKRGDMLEIGLKPRNTYNIKDATMEAEVTMPELTGLELSGSSDALITGFGSAKDLTVVLSGSSSLQGDIDAGNVRIDVSGSSDVLLTGSGQDLAVEASGSSDVELADFPVADADVEASGSSDVNIHASGTLTADASGGSRVRYLGNPTLGRVDTSGGASVERR